jgi:hypothetical protein
MLALVKQVKQIVWDRNTNQNTLDWDVVSFLFSWKFLSRKTKHLQHPVANTGYVLSSMWQTCFTPLQASGAIIVTDGTSIFNLRIYIADGQTNYCEPNVSMHFSNLIYVLCGFWHLNPLCVMEGYLHEGSSYTSITIRHCNMNTDISFTAAWVLKCTNMAVSTTFYKKIKLIWPRVGR